MQRMKLVQQEHAQTTDNERFQLEQYCTYILSIERHIHKQKAKAKETTIPFSKKKQYCDCDKGR